MISIENDVFCIIFRCRANSVYAEFDTNNICSIISKRYSTGNLTKDIDIVISPTEPLPENGTMTISKEGSTDMDINEFPPPGVSIIIQNDKVVVTNKTVTY
jgi:hypothetical protein